VNLARTAVHFRGPSRRSLPLLLLAEGSTELQPGPIPYAVRGLALLDDTGRLRWTATRLFTVAVAAHDNRLRAGASGLKTSSAAAVRKRRHEAELVERISELEEEIERDRRRFLVQRQELARTQRVVAELRARLEMSANLLLEALSPRQLRALGHDGAMLLSYLSGAD